MSDFLTSDPEIKFNIGYAVRQLMSAECILADVEDGLRELGADSDEVVTICSLRSRIATTTLALTTTQRLDENEVEHE